MIWTKLGITHACGWSLWRPLSFNLKAFDLFAFIFHILTFSKVFFLVPKSSLRSFWISEKEIHIWKRMRDFYISHDYSFLKSSESSAMCEISKILFQQCGFNIDIPQNIFYGLWSSQRRPACMGQGSAPGRDRDPGRFSIPGFESQAGTGIPVKSRKFLESFFFFPIFF